MLWVIFNPNENPNYVLELEMKEQTLILYFEKCFEDANARHLLYLEFPQ
jgi:hypothetical protein